MMSVCALFSKPIDLRCLEMQLIVSRIDFITLIEQRNWVDTFNIHFRCRGGLIVTSIRNPILVPKQSITSFSLAHLRVTGLYDGNSIKRPVAWKVFLFDDIIMIKWKILMPQNCYSFTWYIQCLPMFWHKPMWRHNNINCGIQFWYYSHFLPLSNCFIW